MDRASDQADGRSDPDGAAMMRLAEELYPICRSITGDGVRRTLAVLGRHIPITVSEVPTGTRVYDWTVPKEWNIRDAFIARMDGTRVVDFARHNLHVVQYSQPVDRVMAMEELRPHLHTMPDHPDWIPYRTAYSGETWGFCLTQRQLESMTDPRYRAVIDATLADGSLTYGECTLKGAREDTVLFSCHVCHPSLANDNVAGMAVATMLARHLAQTKLRLTYRFLFVPATVGSIAWLARNEASLGRVRHGLVLSCLGDAGGVTYKRSRRGDAAIDRIAAHVLRHDGGPHRIVPFVPYGYDERQYCSPGFDLPVGCLLRTPNGQYPEYHSSADNLALLRPESLAHSLDVLTRIVAVIEGDGIYRNLSPKGEPQLGRRGLYPKTGGHRAVADDQLALLWVLNLADGTHSLLDTAERADLPFARIRAAADMLERVNLLQRVC
jgi:aminopeptidase-like protein